MVEFKTEGDGLMVLATEPLCATASIKLGEDDGEGVTVCFTSTKAGLGGDVEDKLLAGQLQIFLE
jgi:hypothetical protein